MDLAALDRNGPLPMSDDHEWYEVDAKDYLAKTVLVSRKIGPIGFVVFKNTNLIKTKPKPAAAPKKPGKKR